MKPLTTKIHGSTIVVRTLLFSLLWWVLSDGAIASWLIGVPAVLLAVAASVALVPPMPVAWFELLKFVPLFLRHSLLGGVDVAQRVFQPRMPIDPDLVEYPLRLPSGLPQVFMANIVSLLPGTLSAALDRNILTVHVLDRQTGFLAELQMVEQRVALMLNLSLNNPVRDK
jgi:multicomponent Na+:H+ antiporter subunit E